jgi:hypothetical protein
MKKGIVVSTLPLYIVYEVFKAYGSCEAVYPYLRCNEDSSFVLFVVYIIC